MNIIKRFLLKTFFKSEVKCLKNTVANLLLFSNGYDESHGPIQKVLNSFVNRPDRPLSDTLIKEGKLSLHGFILLDQNCASNNLFNVSEDLKKVLGKAQVEYPEMEFLFFCKVPDLFDESNIFDIQYDLYGRKKSGEED